MGEEMLHFDESERDKRKFLGKDIYLHTFMLVQYICKPILDTM